MRNQRVIKTVAVALLSFSLGLHWLVLQSVAWVHCGLDFENESPIAQVIQKTFDDRNACCLCKAFAQSQQAEDEKKGDSNFIKIQAVMHNCTTLVDLPKSTELSIAQKSSALHRRGDPQSPPPQV